VTKLPCGDGRSGIFHKGERMKFTDYILFDAINPELKATDAQVHKG
jgi:hypothetical protein